MFYGKWHQRIHAKLTHHPGRSLWKAFRLKYWVKFVRETWGNQGINTSPPSVEERTSEYLPFDLPWWPKVRVSIIIPVFNQVDYTYSCLQSIFKHTSGIPYEVLLGDDCSTDETTLLSRIVTNLRVIHHKRNLRFLRNCNETAKHARGEFVLFLNNDTNVQAGWLEPLVRLLDNDPMIGLVGSKLIYSDGRLQEAGGIIWNDASGWNYGRLDDPQLPQFNYVREVDYLSGASIMIRTSLWNRLGGFDDRFAPAYFEDSDLAFQVRQAGFKVVYQPQSVVVHFEGISHGTDLTAGQKQYQVINREKFINKWQSVLTSDQLPNAEHVFWARGRTKGKKTILVLDHYVPTYDKDAGGRTSDAFIQILLDLKYHVVFVGDNFYQSEPYTTRLQQMGVEVLYGFWYQQNFYSWFAQNVDYFSAVLLQRPHIAISHIDFFRKFGELKILYYGHDLAHLRLDEQLKIESTEALIKERERLFQMEKKLFDKSNVVLSCSHSEIPLIDEMSPVKKTVFVPPYFYEPIVDSVSFSERSGLLFVGGFGHGPNVDGIVWFCREILPLIQRSNPSIQLQIVGSNPPPEVTSLAALSGVHMLGFVSDAELERLYRSALISVIPLRYGGGVKGKTIEAMHFGIPTVGTKFAYQGIPELEQGERACDSVEAFASELVDLVTDHRYWTKTATRQRQFVDSYFSWKKGRDVFSSILRS